MHPVPSDSSWPLRAEFAAERYGHELTIDRRNAMQVGLRLADRYRLVERVGVGGMGEVWRATDEVLGRVVAVKVVLPSLLGDPEFVRRFLLEARAMASVSHPRVAAIHDYRSQDDGAFLIMEYIDGESLSRILNRRGRLGPATAMDIVAQAADALQAVHDKGIVHRDVKPGNLLIRPDGAVMLTDFGIARAQLDTGMTTAGAILGTPSYLAPEQVLGQPATALSDVYALGLVAYECLSGRRPFEGDSPFAVAMQRVQEAPRTLGENLPRSVLAVIEGALATDPVNRWQSARDLAAAARRALTDLSGGNDHRPRNGAPNAPAGGRAPRRTRAGDSRRPMILTAAVAGVLLIAGAGAWIWAASRPSIGDPHAAGPTAVGSATSAPTAGVGPPGFVPCGDRYCPPAPMCWGGLLVQAGIAREPTPVDCAEPHYWETFVVAILPPGANSVRQETLMQRPDIADICSASVMAQRSRDQAATKGWVRDAWPVQITADTWIMHCIANSGEGERPGSQFRSGRS